MHQRVRISHRGHGPSSAKQLPILAALHARALLCHGYGNPFSAKCKGPDGIFRYKNTFSANCHKMSGNKPAIPAFFAWFSWGRVLK